MKEKKVPKVLIRILIVLAAIAVILSAAFLVIQKNPRAKMLINVIRFAAETLENPAYIAYDVDLKELCTEYINSDVDLSGQALINHVKEIGFSMSMDIDAERSFSQKRASADAELDVLFLSVGDVELYAEDKMAYMVAPMLSNLSYAFDTGINLFWKAPELSSDLDSKWFSDNKANILELTKEISIEENGDYVEDNGIKSIGYHVIIPEGSGGFIWELLSMDPPEHDVAFDIYLTPTCRVRRIVCDLSEVAEDSAIESSVVTLEGTDVGTLIWNVGLPDDETMEIKMVKNGEYTSANILDVSGTYNAKTGDVYTGKCSVSFDMKDNGTDLKVRDAEIYKNDKRLLSAQFEGSITKTKIDDDVFKGREDELYAIDIISWQRLRDDMEGFINDVMEEVKKRI